MLAEERFHWLLACFRSPAGCCICCHFKVKAHIVLEFPRCLGLVQMCWHLLQNTAKKPNALTTSPWKITSNEAV